MPDFHRTSINDESFIRGAARIMWCGTTIAMPGRIQDIINMSTYDATTCWNELGATKTGIQISINNTEEAFDVDQVIGEIKALPTNWECSVGTQLAEMTLDRLSVAWEGTAVTTDNTPPSGPEKSMSIGQPDSYIQRRLAVLFQRPNGKVRAYVFRTVQRLPQESNVTHAKTGEQISVPVRFRCLPDLSVSDLRARFFLIRDQV